MNSNGIKSLLSSGLLRSLLGLFAFIIIVYFLNQYFSERFEHVLNAISDRWILVYSVFIISETIIGILPPELFMILEVNSGGLIYISFLFKLFLLSYLSGIIAYFIGKRARRIPLLRIYIMKEGNKKYVKQYKRYGGIFISIASVTPIPFGLASTISGYMNFPFHKYLLFALPRFLRFFLYGYLMYLGVS